MPIRLAGSRAGISSGPSSALRRQSKDCSAASSLASSPRSLSPRSLVLLWRMPTLDWPVAVGYGLVVGAVAQLGDLMESMIKRDCERKDASTTVPGFGGVLDVIDSLMFAGPVAYILWLWFGP